MERPAMPHYIVTPRPNGQFAIVGPEEMQLCTTGCQQWGNLICDALNTKALPVEPPLRGEFVRLDVDVQPANDVVANPFAQFHAAMVAELARIVAPKIGVNPLPEEFEDVADYLIRFAQACDRMLKEIGAEVSRNATCPVDKAMFDGAFFSALEGYALYEIDKVARVLREDREEVEGEARRGELLDDRWASRDDDLYQTT